MNILTGLNVCAYVKYAFMADQDQWIEDAFLYRESVCFDFHPATKAFCSTRKYIFLSAIEAAFLYNHYIFPDCID